MSEPSPIVLVVDDEIQIRRFLRTGFELNGFVVHEAGTGTEAIRAATLRPIDIVIVDLGLPDMDGADVVERLRSWSTVPIIVLSVRSAETQKVRLLEMGADDYVVKPFSPRELATRAKVILRRATGGGQPVRAPDAGSYAFSDWVLKAGERALVDREGVSLPLSTGEYNLLLALVTHPRQVLTRDQLLDLTQGREAAAFDRAIDNQVSRLRRKIEDDPKNPELIKTVWGGGYTLAAEVTRL